MIAARRDERAADTRRATGAARRRTWRYVEDGDEVQRSRCGPIARRSRLLVKHPGLGDINLRDAALIAAGLFAGAFFGAKITLALPPDAVRKGYAVFMLLIAVRMLLFDK